MRTAPDPLPPARSIALAAVWALLLIGCVSSGEPGPPLRLLSYNIKHGLGMDGRIDLARTAAVIQAQEADVVVLQEVDKGCRRSGGVDQAARLGQLCGMRAWFGPFMRYDGGEYGMAILSRLPVREAHNHPLPPGPEPRTSLAVRVAVDDGLELVVANVHLYSSEAERLAQAQALVDIFAESPVPVILAGDFNSAPGSPVMELLELTWTNLPKNGPSDTFPADLPDREIDAVLLRPAERFVGVRLRVVDQRVASDHRPLILDTTPVWP